ncbi:glycerate kinase [Pararge aegeria]|uniref:Glycerate kinase n=1 Tax=Pararge aegeria aegeria TaxID=348720 RepID=A0A8S4RG23_9NEOP|nr:glycerate kinase [Pararge aegeria]CAH2236000.1 jg3133 [Pararge aegeria aegeria]
MAKNILSDLRQIFKSSVSAVLPENLIRKSICYNCNEQQLTIAGQHYNLKDKNVYVVGFGKAVKNMAIEVEKSLGSKIKQGIISIPFGSSDYKPINDSIAYWQGAENNLPDSKALETATKIKELVTKLKHDDFLLVLLSGGGSALLPLPKYPITLDDKLNLIKKLANSGADIKELNTVRKRISDLKGGQLAILAQPAQVLTLILSDIVGDPLDFIASGPTSKNEDHPSEALNVIKKYKLYKDLPKSIRSVLEDDNHLKMFPLDNVQNIIIGSNKLSTEAATKEAVKLNYFPFVLSNIVTGNVTDLAKEYVELVRIIIAFKKGNINADELKRSLNTLAIPGFDLNKTLYSIDGDDIIKTKDLCLILGGETTVEVKGEGKGGRNQQLSLEFSKVIHDFSNQLTNHEIYFLSAGTDGIDGPTDAAGAIGYLQLISNCLESNIDVDNYIENNDSYNFYRRFQNGELHVITGHTDTNVMDIHLIIIKNKIHK